MGNGANKEDLKHYLASKFMELHNGSEIILVVSRGNSILTNDEILHSSIKINKCTSEEADRIVVCTVDGDVLILLIGNISYTNELEDSTIYTLHGSGSTYYNNTAMDLEFGD